ncbi:hypothetical protein AOLI_G00025570 [Acnodon oligacanthus]
MVLHVLGNLLTEAKPRSLEKRVRGEDVPARSCALGPRGTRARRYKGGSHVQVTHSAVRGAHAPRTERPRNAGGARRNRSEHDADGAQCQNATAPALQARRRREDEAPQALASVTDVLKTRTVSRTPWTSRILLPDEGYKAPRIQLF